MSGQSFSVGVGYKLILPWMALGSLFKLFSTTGRRGIKIGIYKTNCIFYGWNRQHFLHIKWWMRSCWWNINPRACKSASSDVLSLAVVLVVKGDSQAKVRLGAWNIGSGKIDTWNNLLQNFVSGQCKFQLVLKINSQVPCLITLLIFSTIVYDMIHIC